MQVDTIDPVRTAMIVVDMQNDFVAEGAPMETPAARAMVPKLAAALTLCREAAIRVIFTAHVHRRDGSDMGLFDDMHPPIANRAALVDGTPGVKIYPALAPAPGEHVIKKHRYSGFFRNRSGYRSARVGDRYGHHFGDHDRELLFGNRPGRDVSQLSRGVSIGCHRDL